MIDWKLLSVFNKGCWLNITIGIIGIFYSYYIDSIFMGILSGANLGYFSAYMVYKFGVKLDAKRRK